MKDRKVISAGEPRCLVCGRSGDLEWHHVCLRGLFPTVQVPLCRSRHIAIHKLLRISGVSLKPNADRLVERLSTVLHGFHVLIEYLAPLSSEPGPFLVAQRSRRERVGLLLERLSEENGSNSGATLPVRSNRIV